MSALPSLTSTRQQGQPSRDQLPFGTNCRRITVAEVESSCQDLELTPRCPRTRKRGPGPHRRDRLFTHGSNYDKYGPPGIDVGDLRDPRDSSPVAITRPVVYPVDAHQSAQSRLVHGCRQPPDQILEVSGEPGPARANGTLSVRAPCVGQSILRRAARTSKIAGTDGLRAV